MGPRPLHVTLLCRPVLFVRISLGSGPQLRRTFFRASALFGGSVFFFVCYCLCVRCGNLWCCPSVFLLLLLLLPQTRPALPPIIPLLPPAPQEQTHCPQAMRQPSHTASLLPWLMMVVCFAGVCVAADPAVEHHCGFDAMMKKYGRRPTAVVREVPRRGQGAMQAYTAASEDGDDGWAPIRIKVSAEDMYDPSRHCTAAGDLRIGYDGRAITCEADDVLTEERRSIILRQTLPAAIQLHSERLSVKPVTRPVVIPETGLGMCDNFTIPHKYHTAGVAGTDMILHANIFPTAGPRAWAAPCSRLDDGRPVVAAVNFAPRRVAATSRNARVAAHELGHALGFGEKLFVRFNMIAEVPNVRGMPRVSVISTPKTKAMARQYHNRPTPEGIELEDEGGPGNILSHWKKRNMRDEMMTSVAEVGLYSVVTLAAFEDMGFYVAKYSAAEMLWGNNSGCGLLEKKCLTDGITEYPDLFCNHVDGHCFCTYDRLSLGFCGLNRHEEALPEEYRYFADPPSWRRWPLHEQMSVC
ncbi:surface protease GP63, putative [Trypanosoma cruzi marinkellei]|uniref:Leishmanolysin-like peptidase n=1 Tax=Trypanosoma cruzi marinkellei TaxID=85056 RepID=K2MV38_TRYCR|nr:surface protease GP63, putative [Trypanosoma cruzi marinkellei]